MTPFKAVYGCPPHTINTYASGYTLVGHLDSELQDHDHILLRLKEHLLQAQSRMKAQVDKHCSEREFSVGDWVFLHLQPYKQSSLAARHNLKPAPKFYEPYEVLQRIRPIAYKLALPQQSKIHPVFHVSCLKTKMGPNIHPRMTLPPLTEEGYLHPEPERVLDRRWVEKNNHAMIEC